MGTMNGFGMGFGSWLIPLLLIAGIYFLIQRKVLGKTTAQDILDRRYDNGEISKEEYDSKSRDL